MTTAIEFYFDFSSPYAYFAAAIVDGLGQRFGRAVAWKPIMIGSAFKASGNVPLVDQPLKGPYCRHDWERLAQLWQVPYAFPDPFPVAALAPARAYWWLAEQDPALAHSYAKAVFTAYFAQGRNIAEPKEAAAIAAALGIDPMVLLAALQEPRWKQRLKDETEAAIGRGVFGSPFIFADGEGFWGADRLWMVETWLDRGRW